MFVWHIITILQILCCKCDIILIVNSLCYLQKIEELPCLIYDPTLLALAQEVDKSMIPLVTCTDFVYDTSLFQRTMISDFNLVCSKHWLIHVSTSGFMNTSKQNFVNCDND